LGAAGSRAVFGSPKFVLGDKSTIKGFRPSKKPRKVWPGRENSKFLKIPAPPHSWLRKLVPAIWHSAMVEKHTINKKNQPKKQTYEGGNIPAAGFKRLRGGGEGESEEQGGRTSERGVSRNIFLHTWLVDPPNCVGKTK